MNDKTVNYRVLDSVSAFILQFMTLLIFFILVSMSFGENITTATVLSALTNLGPALGDAHSNYSSLQDSSKWVLSLSYAFWQTGNIHHFYSFYTCLLGKLISFLGEL
ncbi:hypothetical protein MNBD_GAMMA02-395 [hydrothermal vent metagenome]|uniref:Uncharacterized protein n=1 Tax=hydrothermal vent metagenome TaxID=652676 RepID=A0A3B0WUY6_9ZZZZ